MSNKISRYEENQVDQFLYEVYLIWGSNLEESACMGEGWITYLESKENYKNNINDVEFWEYIQENVIKRFAELRTIRNEKIRLESRLSLNQKFGEAREKIGTLIPGKQGDFVKYIALWDYAERLNGREYEILRLMNAREDDYDIMRILHLDKGYYYEIKSELRKDFKRYLDEE